VKPATDRNTAPKLNPKDSKIFVSPKCFYDNKIIKVDESYLVIKEIAGISIVSG
jgi:hypothetical protein